MDEYLFTAMMVLFFENTVLRYETEIPQALIDWMDENRHKWALPEASA